MKNTKEIEEIKKELDELAAKNINNLTTIDIVKKSQILDKLIVKVQREKIEQIAR